MGVRITHQGSFTNLERFLRKAVRLPVITRMILDKYGQRGVAALKEATPKRTGKTAESWTYEIETTDGGAAVYWSNTNVNDGVNIALILNFGHGTGTGGYVKGLNYIDPALSGFFENMADEAWKEVTS